MGPSYWEKKILRTIDSIKRPCLKRQSLKDSTSFSLLSFLYSLARTLIAVAL